MATVTGQKYGTTTSLTITPGALANNAQYGSAAVNDSASNLLDRAVTVTFTTGGTVAAPNVLNVYVSVSNDNTTFGDRTTGTNAAQTLTNPPNLRKIDSINCPVASTTYTSNGASIRAALGYMPEFWQLVVENKSGGAIASGLTANALPINQQNV